MVTLRSRQPPPPPSPEHLHTPGRRGGVSSEAASLYLRQVGCFVGKSKPRRCVWRAANQRSCVTASQCFPLSKQRLLSNAQVFDQCRAEPTVKLLVNCPSRCSEMTLCLCVCLRVCARVRERVSGSALLLNSGFSLQTGANQQTITTRQISTTRC